MVSRIARRTRVDQPLSIRRHVRLIGDRLLQLSHCLVRADGYLQLQLARTCHMSIEPRYRNIVSPQAKDEVEPGVT